MGKSKAHYYSYTPERWQFLFDVEAKKVEDLLSEEASRALTTSEILSEIRADFPLEQHATPEQVQAWQGLLTALGLDPKSKNPLKANPSLMPDWLSKAYPSDRYYLALTPAENLMNLAEQIRSSELSEAIGKTRESLGISGPSRLSVVTALMSKAASEGQHLLAIESIR